MPSNGQRFVLFVETAGEQEEPETRSHGRQAPPRKLTALEVPSSGPAYLAIESGEVPQVLSEAPVGEAGVSILETIRHEYQPYLVMLPGAGIRVNGLPVPPVAILRAGDQIRAEGECLLHVSLLTGPRIGPPPDDKIGEECPYCRVKFTADRTAYVCPHCGTAYHCEGDEREENDRLECARLASECYHCHKPLILEERYEYVPDR